VAFLLYLSRYQYILRKCTVVKTPHFVEKIPAFVEFIFISLFRILLLLEWIWNLSL